MKPKEILLNTQQSNGTIDEAGEGHIGSSVETPMRPDAFEMSDDDKVQQIEKKFEEIMDILGLDLSDDSLKGTPRRVAKMYVKVHAVLIL